MRRGLLEKPVRNPLCFMSLISFVFVHSVLLGFIYLRRNLQCYNKNALNLMESDIHINSNFKVEEFMGGNKAYIPAKL